MRKKRQDDGLRKKGTKKNKNCKRYEPKLLWKTSCMHIQWRKGLNELIIIRQGLECEEIFSSKFLEKDVKSIDSRGDNIVVVTKESEE